MNEFTVDRPFETQPCGCVRFPHFFDGGTHYAPYTVECTECTLARLEREKQPETPPEFLGWKPGDRLSTDDEPELAELEGLI